jgi:Pentapeptide repeats (8 copies)
VANLEQEAQLQSSREIWNIWRETHPSEKVDLIEASLRGADLSGASLSFADLSRANLSGADLSDANLSRADLTNIDFRDIDLRRVNLSSANLSGANLSNKDLGHVNLSDANLSGANLSKTLLIETNLTGATLTNCNIYGIAAWNVHLENAIQKNLIITQEHEATITIDNLKVAQFIYLMLNNKEIRDVINTLTTKSVLILGRFTPERKTVLDALRDALRDNNYLPILFDFEKPSSLDLTETVTTLAHLSRFIIVDFTDPSSAPHEAASIIPVCKVPIQPIFEDTGKPYSMSKDFRIYPWVLNVFRYSDTNTLITSLKEYIIEPAEQKAEELEQLKNS